MFGKWFEKKKEIQILSPMTGEKVAITEVPDPTFNEKMIGDGAAILPSSGEVLSPAEGEVIQVFPTMHALGIRTLSGLEILIHVGLETVALKGEGFQALVKAGEKVKAGTPLLRFDLKKIEEKANPISPIVITNMDWVEKLEILPHKPLKAGETPLMRITLK
ncbi:PTS sugar transporter subunit IIA [Thermicanus aegyptius]|uniref:PTS sugar transporter subunit IIA n=1 Tax=Thermicanus aegyptius TaxID=94009 RepID=UPI0003FEC377|nr:PTS glucose transporter subunit IIA [Thermicanus aegyptius]